MLPKLTQGYTQKTKITNQKNYEVHGDGTKNRSMRRHSGEAANGTPMRTITDKWGLIFGAPSRLLSSIPDRVAGQESQFAELPQKCLPRLSTDEREHLGNVSNILRCNEPSRPNLKTCQVAYEPIIGNIGNKVNVLLVFSVVGFVDVCFKGYFKFDKMDGILMSVVNYHIRFQFGNNDIHR